MLRIAVLISGGGTNLQALIDATPVASAKATGTPHGEHVPFPAPLNAEIVKVISDRPGVFGIQRAQKAGIPTVILSRKKYGKSLSNAILNEIKDEADLIVLAGYLSILQGELLNVFRNRIINIHPALIPSFCGDGMYGIKVHEAAIAYGVKVSGCTVHVVDEGTDTGPIILQKTVPVFSEDTPEELKKRILEQEHIALVEAVRFFANNSIKIEDRKVIL